MLTGKVYISDLWSYKVAILAKQQLFFNILTKSGTGTLRENYLITFVKVKTGREGQMRTLIIAVVIALSLLNAIAYADETSKKAIAEDLLQAIKVGQMTKPLYAQMRTMMEQQFT